MFAIFTQHRTQNYAMIIVSKIQFMNQFIIHHHIFLHF